MSGWLAPDAGSAPPRRASGAAASGAAGGSAAEALGEHGLALLGALAAFALRAAEEVREILVAVTLGVRRVLLEAQCVAQALLREPDDVVVLVLRAGDLAG